MIKFEMEIRGEADETQRLQARGVIALLSTVFGPTVLNTGMTAASGSLPASDFIPIRTVPLPADTAATVFATVETQDDDSAPAGDGSGVDQDGMPWDERIHSSNKQKNADGRWRAKRGVSNALVDQVTKELKGEPAPPVVSTVPAPPVATAPAVPAPPVAAVTGALDFPGFMRQVTGNQERGVDVMGLFPEFSSITTAMGLPAVTSYVQFSDSGALKTLRGDFLTFLAAK